MLHPHYQKKRRRRRRKRLRNACDPTDFMFPIIASSYLAMPIVWSSDSSCFSLQKDKTLHKMDTSKISHQLQIKHELDGIRVSLIYV